MDCGNAKLRSKVLFLDWRDVACGYVHWLTAGGAKHGVGNPPEPQVEMQARPVGVPHGIRLVAMPAQKTEPLEDWQGWGRIVYHEGKYRSWFLEVDGNTKHGSGRYAQKADRHEIYICSVESEDGFHWSTPRKGRIDLPGQYGFDGQTFFIDPAAPPAERYKFVYCATPPAEMKEALYAEYLRWASRFPDPRVVTGDVRSCLFAATSPDGLRWTPIREPLMMHCSDTDTTVYWDAALGKYVLYTRMFFQDRRWIGRAESDDFRHWRPVEPIIWPRLDDPPDYDFYLNGYTDYPGLPEYRLLFPMLYFRYTERSEVRLYASTDGMVWNQAPGGPVITPGQAGAWDCEFIGGGKDLVPLGPGRVAMPYSGTSYPHKYPRWPAVWEAWKAAWAWWPEDRLCALTADQEGEFQTFPLVPAGRTLRLNLRTPRAGEVRVGLVGVEGRAVEDCDPAHGDLPAHTVTWKGQSDLGVPENKPVSLHFKLRCAELFALEWR